MWAQALPWLCIVTVQGVLSGAAPAQFSPASEAEQPPQLSDSWTEEKCVLYKHIFSDALTLQGHEGLSNDFLSTNQRFIDKGCKGERTLCPHSEAELAFADLLTVMTMNEGMASTFVPFGCAD